MVKYKTRLIIVWLSGFVFLLTIVFFQTIFGAYGNTFWGAWKWLAQTFIPPVSLIVGVIFSNLKKQSWRHEQIHQDYPMFRQRKIQILQDLHKLLNDKIEALRKGYVIEINNTQQFILQQEIQQAQFEQQKIEKEIIFIDNIKEKHNMELSSIWFYLTLCLSLIYLGLLIACIFAKPFIPSVTPVELLEMSIPFVIPLQGLVIVVHVMFFMGNIEEEAI